MTEYLTSAEEILGIDDLETEEVEVPEWGGTVIVRGLTGAERDEFESEFAEATGTSKTIEVQGRKTKLNMSNARARLVARCVIDEEGNRVFSEQHVKKLGEKSGKALDRVYEVAADLSGINEQDLEELQGNLNGAPSESSGTDSA